MVVRSSSGWQPDTPVTWGILVEGWRWSLSAIFSMAPSSSWSRFEPGEDVARKNVVEMRVARDGGTERAHFPAQSCGHGCDPRPARSTMERNSDLDFRNYCHMSAQDR